MSRLYSFSSTDEFSLNDKTISKTININKGITMCGGGAPSFSPPPPPPVEADYKKAAVTERDKTRKRAGLNKTILTDAMGNTQDTLNTDKKTLLGQ